MTTILGRLGAADLASATNTAVYTVPASKRATVTLSVCNRSASTVTVRVAYIDSASLGDLALADYLYYDAPISAGGWLKESGIPMTAQHMLMVRASAADVSAVVLGIEEDA